MKGYKIFNENCFSTMERFIEKNKKVNIILTSPPYNTARCVNTERSREIMNQRYDVHFDNWETYDLVTAWNERCEEQCLYDERIEDMYSFDELYDGMKPTEIADMLHNAKFTTGDDYFEFNRHGNISSFSYISDSDWFDMDELAEFIAENGLRNVDIDELIDDITVTFIEEHFEDDDIDDETIKDIICENDFSVLHYDWDELETLIREYLDGDGEDDNE